MKYWWHRSTAFRWKEAEALRDQGWSHFGKYSWFCSGSHSELSVWDLDANILSRIVKVWIYHNKRLCCPYSDLWNSGWLFFSSVKAESGKKGKTSQKVSGSAVWGLGFSRPPQFSPCSSRSKARPPEVCSSWVGRCQSGWKVGWLVKRA